MPNPRPCPRFAIHRRLLDIDILVCRVKVEGADRRSLPRHGTLHADFLQERSIDEVHVLAGDREQPHDREEQEGAHGPGIIVARKPAVGVIERRRDVLVSPFRRQARAAGIVVKENREEDGLVGNICQAALMEKV